MCQSFAKAPLQIKETLLPIMAEMHTPNMMAACAILAEQSSDYRSTLAIRQWLQANCDLCDMCKAKP